MNFVVPGRKFSVIVGIQMRTLVLFACALACTAAFADQGKGKGKGKNQGTGGRVIAVSVVFSESDRLAIRNWAHEVPPAGLPPGLAKRGDLPPGLQKQLRKKGTLPPGLRKKISPFPVELAARLGPLPADCGCDRVFLDGKALIIARATSAILDVISLF
jgi:hypothetical protein